MDSGLLKRPHRLIEVKQYESPQQDCDYLPRLIGGGSVIGGRFIGVRLYTKPKPGKMHLTKSRLVFVGLEGGVSFLR